MSHIFFCFRMHVVKCKGVNGASLSLLNVTGSVLKCTGRTWILCSYSQDHLLIRDQTYHVKLHNLQYVCPIRCYIQTTVYFLFQQAICFFIAQNTTVEVPPNTFSRSSNQTITIIAYSSNKISEGSIYMSGACITPHLST